MAILIDEARWWFRGRRWCHLVSDASLEELHRFAETRASAGAASRVTTTTCPRLRPALIAGGAQVVPSRELLQRLREAGTAPDSGAAPAVHQRGGSPS